MKVIEPNANAGLNEFCWIMVPKCVLWFWTKCLHLKTAALARDLCPKKSTSIQTRKLGACTGQLREDKDQEWKGMGPSDGPKQIMQSTLDHGDSWRTCGSFVNAATQMKQKWHVPFHFVSNCCCQDCAVLPDKTFGVNCSIPKHQAEMSDDKKTVKVCVKFATCTERIRGECDFTQWVLFKNSRTNKWPQTKTAAASTSFVEMTRSCMQLRPSVLDWFDSDQKSAFKCRLCTG